MSIDLDDAWDMARHDPRVFDQLFRGVFLDSDTQYIPSELIQRQTTDQPPDRYADTWAGLDIGESRDKTALIVLQGDRSRVIVRHLEVHDRTDDELIRHLCDQAFRVYGCSRLAVDATGMGSFPAKAARRVHGPKLEPVQFTSKTKEDMASRLYQSLADGTLWLPRGMGELRDDIAAIRRIVTTAGNVRFDAPRTAKGHADRAWAIMLALHAAGRSARADGYRQIRQLRPRATIEDMMA